MASDQLVSLSAQGGKLPERFGVSTKPGPTSYQPALARSVSVGEALREPLARKSPNPTPGFLYVGGQTVIYFVSVVD